MCTVAVVLEKDSFKEADVSDTAREKLRHLCAYLQELGSVAVAFSGGVDSTFLLKAAHDVLGDRAIAVTVRSCLFPEREFEEAKVFCEQEYIRQFVCTVNSLEIGGFSDNPPNRCYLCKKYLFEKMQYIAQREKAAYVAEGSNVDDNGDYRPGLIAVAELGIQSPLRAAGLLKSEIRELSKALGLPTWDKPSFACLASRFVYGEKITAQKLSMIGQAEQLLLDRGFKQVRVRMHGQMARIEVMPQDFEKLIRADVCAEVTKKLKACGFTYVAMDLDGYQTGSMNEMILK